MSPFETSKSGSAVRNHIAVSSTSAMTPSANMKAVIPNMHILDEDEVKPSLLLKTIHHKHASPFLRKHNSQEDVDRDKVNNDISTCDHTRAQWLRDWTSDGESLVPHHIWFR